MERVEEVGEDGSNTVVGKKHSTWKKKKQFGKLSRKTTKKKKSDRRTNYKMGKTYIKKKVVPKTSFIPHFPGTRLLFHKNFSLFGKSLV